MHPVLEEFKKLFVLIMLLGCFVTWPEKMGSKLDDAMEIVLLHILTLIILSIVIWGKECANVRDYISRKILSVCNHSRVKVYTFFYRQLGC